MLRASPWALRRAERQRRQLRRGGKGRAAAACFQRLPYNSAV
jgi:hypothetical protein